VGWYQLIITNAWESGNARCRPGIAPWSARARLNSSPNSAARCCRASLRSRLSFFPSGVAGNSTRAASRTRVVPRKRARIPAGLRGRGEAHEIHHSQVDASSPPFSIDSKTARVLIGKCAAQSAATAQACIKLGELLEVRSDPAVVKLRSMMAEHVQQARD
jgi:hypothetical protein